MSPRLLGTSIAAALTAALLAPVAPATGVGADHYRNPLRPTVSDDQVVESCADPVVMRGREQHRNRWYMFCTTDPLNDAETAPDGAPPFHPIPMMVSRDLVNWRYVGDALPEKPSWADPGANLWAPDLAYSRVTQRYYLTFTVTDTDAAVSGEPNCAGDSAIGVATSRNPTGPWRVSDTPVIAPRRAGPGCNFFWTFDPDVLGDSIGRSSIMYYGSYFGGVFGQRIQLTKRGITTSGAARLIASGVDDEGSKLFEHAKLTRRGVELTSGNARATGDPQPVTIPNRYEGSNVVKRGGWYYYFGSATNCCNGPLTGYSVFAGRSRSPLGPFVDREGNSLLAGRVGGTPVISMNGNRWIGTGHNTTFRDRDGQWWTVYHAVNRFHPYFAGEPGFTKRPALLDPVTWRHGWPSVRAGRWASTKRMPAPAAQPGEQSRYRAHAVRPQRLGERLARFSDSFSGSSLGKRWTWVREPDASTYGVGGGVFRFDVQQADLNTDNNTASVLTRPAPKGNFVVQTKVAIDVPPEGCCFNFAQAGVILYGSDNAFVKLTNTSIFETRQTEWAKEVPTAPVLPDGTQRRYGNTVVGAPGDVTWLRIVKVTRGGDTLLTAYTSQDGSRWVRGGTWVHNRLGNDLRIGLISMGATEPMAFTARFDDVRVWSLRR